jgi:hypothetical protein
MKLMADFNKVNTMYFKFKAQKNKPLIMIGLLLTSQFSLASSVNFEARIETVTEVYEDSRNVYFKIQGLDEYIGSGCMVSGNLYNLFVPKDRVIGGDTLAGNQAYISTLKTLAIAKNMVVKIWVTAYGSDAVGSSYPLDCSLGYPHAHPTLMEIVKY